MFTIIVAVVFLIGMALVMFRPETKPQVHLVLAKYQKRAETAKRINEDFMDKKNKITEEMQELGRLAMSFRSAQAYEKPIIAQKYAEVVDRLIITESWDKAPAPEDLLPEEYLSQNYLDYWRYKSEMMMIL